MNVCIVILLFKASADNMMFYLADTMPHIFNCVLKGRHNESLTNIRRGSVLVQLTIGFRRANKMLFHNLFLFSTSRTH